ncbi:MAG TPA: flagellin [Bryobacteraceae bacterium]|jgi:flagellin|nr:flagellin [Bryobacteraceae bacterium]
MSISFQTNYAALVAQNNLNTNSNFQTHTIEALTSGYRINQSGDDAAGLAVANNYQSSITELTQGVLNGNAGVNTLQIADGGLSNITNILDRLKTLATESASSTFTGDRSNINVEYQQLVQQISQQADNIGLGANGSLNVKNQVYIGGGNTAANSQIEVDLSGTQNQVDAIGLGLNNTSVLGGGTELTGNTARLDAPGASFLAAGSQAFTFNLASGGAATSVTATVTGGTSGLSESQVLSSLNGQLSQYGITASVGSDGQLSFGGTTAFTVSAAAASAGTEIASTAATGTNNGVYSVAGAATFTSAAETLTFQNGQGTATVALAASTSLTNALAAINAKTQSLGISAIENAAGTGISFQSVNNFTASSTAATATFTAAGAQATTAPSTGSTATGNAVAAIAAINAAISQLGNVQSRVGAGENVLNHAISLANSQITNFSAAESGIRDADVATEAANLTKAQVIQQASVAALAQANSAPQALLKLLQ